MYKRILVAVDGSANAKRAAEHAAYLASLHPGTIVQALYILDYDRTRSDIIPNASSDDLHIDRQKQLAPIENVFKQRNVSYELIIKHGEAGPTIVKFANSNGFDLVIVGSRGLNTFQEMVLGSVSHKVAKRVTAVLPHSDNIFEQKVPAASFVLNGFGKTAGLIQIEELGVIESPIMLTNTFSVGAVLEGTLAHMLEENPTIGDSTSSLNVVVGECNDSYLNSMRLMKIKPPHAIEAIQNATSGPVEQGAIGAGKGMICFGMKGGIGSSSRVLQKDDGNYTVGVLTLTNFGKVGECKIDDWLRQHGSEATNGMPQSAADDVKPDGSVIIIVATDAPVNERQLKRFAKRAAIGLGRTGTHIHNGSGDIIIAFSNGFTIPHRSEQITTTYACLRDDHPLMNDLFQAVIEATEEAVYQSLIHAETTHGRQGRIVEKWPISETSS